jgi:hypothetical protein
MTKWTSTGRTTMPKQECVVPDNECPPKYLEDSLEGFDPEKVERFIVWDSDMLSLRAPHDPENCRLIVKAEAYDRLLALYREAVKCK